MSADYDATEFIDGDIQAARRASRGPGPGQALRAPTREEVDARVAEAQQRLADLKRAQEGLERERAQLEETRRRQIEFQTSRQETLQNLTRGVGLLSEAEFAARRDAEQLAKTVADLRESLAKVESIREQTWTGENFSVELTRALTTLENARMEWNSARLKFPLLCAATQAEGAATPEAPALARSSLADLSLGDLCRLGFALTWPLALVMLGALAVLIVVLFRH